jgi:hypothetical protein
VRTAEQWHEPGVLTGLPTTKIPGNSYNSFNPLAEHIGVSFFNPKNRNQLQISQFATENMKLKKWPPWYVLISYVGLGNPSIIFLINQLIVLTIDSSIDSLID